MTAAEAASRALAYLFEPATGLLADRDVTEILINGPDAAWFERHGALQPVRLALSGVQLQAVARLVETLSQTDTLERDCVLEGRWQDWRVTMALPPVSDQACLAMRRHNAVALPLECWEARAGNRIPGQVQGARALAGPVPTALECLRAALRAHHNLLIAGSTGSGKTTLLASLLRELGDGERLVCLEDNPELPVLGPHQLRLQTRAGHSLRSLLRLALRLRPDRLVVGEVRGGEAFDLLQAMATGHRGCLGTIHAPDARGALARLEQLILTTGLAWPLEAVRRQIALWVDLVVHVRRTPQGRAIAGIDRVAGVDDSGYRLQPLVYRREPG